MASLRRLEALLSRLSISDEPERVRGPAELRAFGTASRSAVACGASVGGAGEYKASKKLVTASPSPEPFARVPLISASTTKPAVKLPASAGLADDDWDEHCRPPRQIVGPFLHPNLDVSHVQVPTSSVDPALWVQAAKQLSLAEFAALIRGKKSPDARFAFNAATMKLQDDSRRKRKGRAFPALADGAVELPATVYRIRSKLWAVKGSPPAVSAGATGADEAHKHLCVYNGRIGIISAQSPNVWQLALGGVWPCDPLLSDKALRPIDAELARESERRTVQAAADAAAQRAADHAASRAASGRARLAALRRFMCHLDDDRDSVESADDDDHDVDDDDDDDDGDAVALAPVELSLLLDLGYIGDVMNEFAAACELQTRLKTSGVAGAPPLLRAIAAPGLRKRALYREPSAAEVSPDADCPLLLNEGQLAALRALECNVEGIQGPPGTGKSTVICALIALFLPRPAATTGAGGAASRSRTGVVGVVGAAGGAGARASAGAIARRASAATAAAGARTVCREVALATCVQNKAVDAMAEKLAAYYSACVRAGTPPLRFFVFGSKERLGLTARQWTLDAQVERDPRLEAWAGRYFRMQAVADILRATVARNADRASRCETLRERRMQLALAKFGDPSKLKTGNPARERKEAAIASFMASDPWIRCWAALWRASNPAVVAGAAYAGRAAEALLLQKQQAEDVIKADIVASSRAVLCTVATASSRLLTDKYLRGITGHITTAILDEAGTCPEPKLALLLLLPRLARIIAIGDHLQLAPFTRWSRESALAAVLASRADAAVAGAAGGALAMIPAGKAKVSAKGFLATAKATAKAKVKVKLCRFWAKGMCKLGAACKFDHPCEPDDGLDLDLGLGLGFDFDLDDIDDVPAARSSFAASAAPGVSTDAVSARRLCFRWAVDGICPFGARCKFKHPSAATGGGTSGGGFAAAFGGAGTADASPSAPTASELTPLLRDPPLGFFQRLVAALPAGAVPCLRFQYRMHPAIAAWVGKRIYKGLLATPPSVAAARAAADSIGLYWLRYAIPAGLPSGGAEDPAVDSMSRSNSTEVALALRVFQLGEAAGYLCTPPPLPEKKKPKKGGARGAAAAASSASAAAAALAFGRSVMVITLYRDQERALRAAFAANHIYERESAADAPPCETPVSAGSRDAADWYTFASPAVGGAGAAGPRAGGAAGECLHSAAPTSSAPLAVPAGDMAAPLDRRGSLRILTVDQAQGSEADVVILSCVRSNRERNVGFARVANRLNVAISRARERLVIIGDPRTMGADPLWASLIAAAAAVDSPEALPPMARRC